MIELSKGEMLTMNRNIITASGMRQDAKGILNYTTLNHGKNVELQGNTSTSRLKSDTKHYQFNISRVSKQYLLICAKKSECMLHYRNVRIIDSSYAIGKVCKTEKKYKPSGMVVIFMVRLDSTPKIDKSPWDYTLYKKIKKCKPNILGGKKKKHHGSTGYYYSFGNRGDYKTLDGVSVTTYASKGNNDDATLVENLCAAVLKDAIDNLSTLIRNLKDMISPVLSAAYKYQNELKCNVMSDVESSKHGVWQSQICVNAQTSELHTETDCTYTIIGVPNQNTKALPKRRKDNLFLLHLNDNNVFAIPMLPSTYFMFSGLYITHRQNSGGFSIANRELFFNVSSYGNQHLFNHLRCTFIRKVDK